MILTTVMHAASQMQNSHLLAFVREVSRTLVYVEWETLHGIRDMPG